MCTVALVMQLLYTTTMLLEEETAEDTQQDWAGVGDAVAEVIFLWPTGTLPAVVEVAGEEVEEVELPLLWVPYSPNPTQEITGHGLRALWDLGLARLRVEEEELGTGAAHRVEHLLEGPLLAEAETHGTQDSTAALKMMTE